LSRLCSACHNLFTNSEIIPTRCNNCVYSSQWLYSTCIGRHLVGIISLLSMMHGTTNIKLFTNSQTCRLVLQLRACQGHCIPQTEFQIDKIVRTRNRNCIKQHLVKCKGYDETFKPWVNSSDIKKNITAFLHDIAIRRYRLLFS